MQPKKRKATFRYASQALEYDFAGDSQCHFRVSSLQPQVKVRVLGVDGGRLQLTCRSGEEYQGIKVDQACSAQGEMLDESMCDVFQSQRHLHSPC